MADKDSFDVQKILAEWAKGGLEELFKSSELRDPCLKLLTAWGCPTPIGYIVYTALARLLIYGHELAGEYFSDRAFEWARKWGFFQRLIVAIEDIRKKCDSKAQLSQLLLSSLSDSNVNIEIEANELLPMDALFILRQERNFQWLSEILKISLEEVRNIGRQLDELPSILNAPTLTDPTRHANDQNRPGEVNKLFFGEAFDLFIGRKHDVKFLEDFLFCKDARTGRFREFAWQVICGDGGAGKSRLALHILQRAQPLWRGGFVKVDDIIKKNIRQWRPSTDTILIVDYAGTNALLVGRFLDDLRHASAGYNGVHLRVILLERVADEWVELIKQSVSGNGLRHTEFDKPYYISRLKDSELILFIKNRIERRGGVVNLDDDEIVFRLSSIDINKRPIFAAIIADSLVEGGDPNCLTRDELLLSVLEKEYTRYWLTREELDAANRDVTYVRHIHLLMLSTMTKSLKRSIYRKLPFKELGLPNPDPLQNYGFDVNRFGRMTRIVGEDYFEGLQPDLIGELFVLKGFQERFGNKGKTSAVRQRLIDAAWAIQPMEMGRFIIRCAQDYGQILANLDFLKPSLQNVEARIWFARSAVGIIQGKLELRFERELFESLKKLRAAYGAREDVEFAEELARAATNLLIDEIDQDKFSQALELLVFLGSLHRLHIANENIWEKLARSAALYLGRTGQFRGTASADWLMGILEAEIADLSADSLKLMLQRARRDLAKYILGTKFDEKVTYTVINPGSSVFQENATVLRSPVFASLSSVLSPRDLRIMAIGVNEFEEEISLVENTVTMSMLQSVVVDDSSLTLIAAAVAPETTVLNEIAADSGKKYVSSDAGFDAKRNITRFLPFIILAAAVAVTSGIILFALAAGR